jgi:hypothetical protein
VRRSAARSCGSQSLISSTDRRPARSTWRAMACRVRTRHIGQRGGRALLGIERL